MDYNAALQQMLGDSYDFAQSALLAADLTVKDNIDNYRLHHHERLYRAGSAFKNFLAAIGIGQGSDVRILRNRAKSLSSTPLPRQEQATSRVAQGALRLPETQPPSSPPHSNSSAILKRMNHIITHLQTRQKDPLEGSLTFAQIDTELIGARQGLTATTNLNNIHSQMLPHLLLSLLADLPKPASNKPSSSTFIHSLSPKVQAALKNVCLYLKTQPHLNYWSKQLGHCLSSTDPDHFIKIAHELITNPAIFNAPAAPSVLQAALAAPHQVPDDLFIPQQAHPHPKASKRSTRAATSSQPPAAAAPKASKPKPTAAAPAPPVADATRAALLADIQKRRKPGDD